MLSAAFRQSCCLGLLDRPLLLALLVGAVTGEWEHILPLGIVLELFWLAFLDMLVAYHLENLRHKFL